MVVHSHIVPHSAVYNIVASGCVYSIYIIYYTLSWMFCLRKAFHSFTLPFALLTAKVSVCIYVTLLCVPKDF